MTDLSQIFPGQPAPPPAAQPQAAPAAAPPQQYAPPAAPPQQNAQPPAAPPQQGGGFDAWMGAVVGAEVTNRGAEYMPGGGNVLGRIDLIKHITKDNGGDAIAIEFTVLESATNHLPVGSQWCLFRDVPGNRGMGAADIKTWLYTLVQGIAKHTNREAPPFTQELVRAAVSESQPFKDQLLHVQSTDRTMQNGGTFTRYKVEYMPPGTSLGLHAQ